MIPLTLAQAQKIVGDPLQAGFTPAADIENQAWKTCVDAVLGHVPPSYYFPACYGNSSPLTFASENGKHLMLFLLLCRMATNPAFCSVYSPLMLPSVSDNGDSGIVVEALSSAQRDAHNKIDQVRINGESRPIVYLLQMFDAHPGGVSHLPLTRDRVMCLTILTTYYLLHGMHSLVPQGCHLCMHSSTWPSDAAASTASHAQQQASSIVNQRSVRLTVSPLIAAAEVTTTAPSSSTRASPSTSSSAAMIIWSSVEARKEAEKVKSLGLHRPHLDDKDATDAEITTISIFPSPTSEVAVKVEFDVNGYILHKHKKGGDKTTGGEGGQRSCCEICECICDCLCAVLDAFD